jgi:hypothetical protein
MYKSIPLKSYLCVTLLTCMNPNTPVSFEDTAVAFSYKSNNALKKAHFIFSLISSSLVSSAAIRLVCLPQQQRDGESERQASNAQRFAALGTAPSKRARAQSPTLLRARRGNVDACHQIVAP